LKLELFILITLVCFAELLSDFSYTNFTVSYADALDRLRVHLNIILLRPYSCSVMRRPIGLSFPPVTQYTPTNISLSQFLRLWEFIQATKAA